MFGLLNSRQEIIERISFLSGCGHRFILLTGDKGVGKSTVIEYLLESYLEEFVRKYVSVSPNINDIQVRSLMLEAVFPDASFDPEISLVKSFTAHIEDTEEKFLIIDNAQNISEQVSAELLQLSLNPERFNLSILFASQSDSSNVKLLSEHSSVVSVNVDCLDLDESKQFLDYHFEELANEDLVTEFILKTGGHPQRLQQWEQRDSILDSVSTETTEPKSINWRIPVIVAVALIGAIAIQSYFYFGSENTEPKMVVTQPSIKKPSNVTAEQITAEESNTEENAQPLSDTNDIDSNNTALAADWNEPTNSEPEEQSAEAFIEDSATELDTDVDTDQETLEVDTVAQADQETNAESANSDNTLSIAERDVEITAVQATTVSDTVEPISDSNESNINSAQALSLIDKGINVQMPTWFKQLPEQSYFLQASGVSSTDTLEQFLRFENIIDQTVIYQTTRNNSPWFVVLFGPYDNADQARNAISDLPVSIQKLDPWAKSLTAIKRELPTASSTQ